MEAVIEEAGIPHLLQVKGERQDDNPLLTAPNYIITPHISWAAKESHGRIMDIIADNIQSFLNGNQKKL